MHEFAEFVLIVACAHAQDRFCGVILARASKVQLQSVFLTLVSSRTTCYISYCTYLWKLLLHMDIAVLPRMDIALMAK